MAGNGSKQNGHVDRLSVKPLIKISKSQNPWFSVIEHRRAHFMVIKSKISTYVCSFDKKNQNQYQDNFWDCFFLISRLCSWFLYQDLTQDSWQTSGRESIPDPLMICSEFFSGKLVIWKCFHYSIWNNSSEIWQSKIYGSSMPCVMIRGSIQRVIDFLRFGWIFEWWHFWNNDQPKS